MASQPIDNPSAKRNFEVYHEHRWELTPTEAVAMQRALASEVRLAPLEKAPGRIAGVDVSVRNGVAQAAVIVVDAATMQPLDGATWREPARFPYISGLLSFREIPTLLQAFERLSTKPDVILCDGQGIAHPRRLGLASHLGVLLDMATVGVAKSRLVGTAEEPAQEVGAWAPLVHRDELIGAVLRTRVGVKPLFVSPGHRVTLEDAVALTLACTRRYRLPEPTRLAHHLSRTQAVQNEMQGRETSA